MESLRCWGKKTNVWQNAAVCTKYFRSRFLRAFPSFKHAGGMDGGGDGAVLARRRCSTLPRFRYISHVPGTRTSPTAPYLQSVPALIGCGVVTCVVTTITVWLCKMSLQRLWWQTHSVCNQYAAAAANNNNKNNNNTVEIIASTLNVSVFVYAASAWISPCSRITLSRTSVCQLLLLEWPSLKCTTLRYKACACVLLAVS